MSIFVLQKTESVILTNITINGRRRKRKRNYKFSKDSYFWKYVKMFWKDFFIGRYGISNKDGRMLVRRGNS